MEDDVERLQIRDIAPDLSPKLPSAFDMSEVEPLRSRINDSLEPLARDYFDVTKEHSKILNDEFKPTTESFENHNISENHSINFQKQDMATLSSIRAVSASQSATYSTNMDTYSANYSGKHSANNSANISGNDSGNNSGTRGSEQPNREDYWHDITPSFSLLNSINGDSPAVSLGEDPYDENSRNLRGGSISPNSRRPHVSSKGSPLAKESPFKQSPFDHMDSLLPDAKQGLLSFENLAGSARNEPTDSDRPLASTNSTDTNSTDTNSTNVNAASNGGTDSRSSSRPIQGVRQREAYARHLESENLELRLKLQQYREMNAGADEFTRMKRQVRLSEGRIDELEKSLERKNAVIRDLTNERDAVLEDLDGARQAEHQRDELYGQLSDLQAAIDELEHDQNQEREVNSRHFATAHAEFSDIVPQEAGIPHLIEAIRTVREDNAKLMNVASLASNLKASHNAIKKEVGQAYPKSPNMEPSRCIRELLGERDELNAENAKLRAAQARMAAMHEQETHNSDSKLAKAQRALRALEIDSQGARRDLETRLGEVTKVSTECRTSCYDIIQKLFNVLFSVLGVEFQETVEQQLSVVVTTAKEKGTSKIPMLTALLVEYTRQVAMMARDSKTNSDNDRMRQNLENQVQSLEHIVELRMDKIGADAILRARIRDLNRELKMEQEKRKSEWLEYKRRIDHN